MTILIAIVIGLITLISAGLLIKHKASNLGDKQDLVASLDKQLNKLFKDQQSHAIVVGVIKNHHTHYKAYGVMNKGSEQSPDAQSIFQIGSITKVFTTSLLQVLSDKGIVSIDATLGTLIGDTVPLSDKAAAITLRQLATHTSGLPRIPGQILSQIESISGKANIMSDPYNFLNLMDMFAYLEHTKDASNPGKFNYSNYGMGLLGHVLEKVTDETLENLLRAYLFEPLDMNNTGITLPQHLSPFAAQGYDEKGKAAGFWNFSVLAGAGAIHSNMEEMLKFVRASLSTGSDANKRFEIMRQPQYGGKSGLGWMQPGLNEKFFGNRNFYWHNGMVGGYSSYIAISPVDNAGIVVLTSRAIDATMLGIMLTRQLRTQSWSRAE